MKKITLPPSILIDALINPWRFFYKINKNYGDLVKLGPKIYFINERDLVRKIFLHKGSEISKQTFIWKTAKKVANNGIVTSEGEVWKKQNLESKEFFSNLLTNDVIAKIQKISEKKIDETRNLTKIELRYFTTEYTIEVLFASVFKINCNQNIFDELAKIIFKIIKRYDSIPKQLLPSYLPLPINFHFKSNLKKFYWLIETIVQQNVNKLENENSLINRITNRNKDFGKQLEEIATYIIAGSETTSTLIQWTIIYLIKRPENTIEIRDEINQNADDYGHINYKGKLYNLLVNISKIVPSVWGTSRYIEDDIELNNLKFKKGDTLFIIPFLFNNNFENLNCDNDIVEQVLKCDLVKNPAKTISFGMGKRACLGQALAFTEAYFITKEFITKDFEFGLNNEIQLDRGMRPYNIILTKKHKS